MNAKKVLVAIAAGLLLAAASAQAGSPPPFKTGFLKGNYMISACGFMSDEASEVGTLCFIGELTLNGAGGVTCGGLAVSSSENDGSGFADSGGCAVTCSGSGSAYSITDASFGSGDLDIDLSGIDSCFDDTGTSVDLEFAFYLPSNNTAAIPIVSTDLSAALSADDLEDGSASDDLNGLVLAGTLQKQ